MKQYKDIFKEEIGSNYFNILKCFIKKERLVLKILSKIKTLTLKVLNNKSLNQKHK